MVFANAAVVGSWQNRNCSTQKFSSFNYLAGKCHVRTQSNSLTAIGTLFFGFFFLIKRRKQKTIISFLWGGGGRNNQTFKFFCHSLFFLLCFGKASSQTTQNELVEIGFLKNKIIMPCHMFGRMLTYNTIFRRLNEFDKNRFIRLEIYHPNLFK